MKKLLIFTSFILSISFSFGQTQGEMNQESFKEYQKSEKELNSVYQKILKEYKSDNIFLSNLRKAQRIWIQFRDAEVKAMYPDREAGYYGSIHPMCVSGYMKELTDDRIKKLRIWLTGTDEGDACSGTIKGKN